MPPSDPAQSPIAAMFESAYARLLGRARALMGGERANHTLEPSALLHEVYLRLRQSDDLSWRSATHFECLAGKVMRQVLVDHAKASAREKRGGGAMRVTLSEAVSPSASPAHIELLALHDALDKLARHDPRAAAVLEARLFSASTVREIAEALDLSYETAKADWLYGRAWLIRELRA